MRGALRLGVVLLAACLMAVAGVFSAYASPAAPAAVARPSASDHRFAAVRSPAPASCDQLQASGIAWVTLTADHHVDKQVSSYPSGASDITPIFQYNCAPANTVIVSVFSLNGLTLFSDQEQIPANSFASLYGYDLETNDGSPLSDGQWSVQYFNNKTPLTSGTVTVGTASTDPTQTMSATVQGTVQDQNSQMPIEGAVILVLNPGVQLQDFLQNGQNQSDVYTVGKSDSQGNFTLQKKLTRHQPYAMIVTAEGYKPLGNQSFEVNDEPDPVSITVSMTQ